MYATSFLTLSSCCLKNGNLAEFSMALASGFPLRFWKCDYDGITIYLLNCGKTIFEFLWSNPCVVFFSELDVSAATQPEQPTNTPSNTCVHVNDKL
jgi:hypothetical protein